MLIPPARVYHSKAIVWFSSRSGVRRNYPYAYGFQICLAHLRSIAGVAVRATGPALSFVAQYPQLVCDWAIKMLFPSILMDL